MPCRWRAWCSTQDRLVCLDEHFGDSPKLPISDLVAFAPLAHATVLRVVS